MHSIYNMVVEWEAVFFSQIFSDDSCDLQPNYD